MKVDMNVSRVISIYSKNTKENNSILSTQRRNDSIEISKEGRIFQKYIEIAKDTEIKNDRLNEIKRLIDEGKYNVDSQKLSECIMEYIKESDR